jgi:hypothetical protein
MHVAKDTGLTPQQIAAHLFAAWCETSGVQMVELPGTGNVYFVPQDNLDDPTGNSACPVCGM